MRQGTRFLVKVSCAGRLPVSVRAVVGFDAFQLPMTVTLASTTTCCCIRWH
jgi:hypothetical protein